MTVKELSEVSGFEAVCLPDPDREIEGGYCGDLLSWVMGRATSGQAWITIMSNVNIIAVATLCDVAVIVLSENVSLDDGVKDTAEMRGINVIKTAMPTFEAALEIAKLI